MRFWRKLADSLAVWWEIKLLPESWSPPRLHFFLTHEMWCFFRSHRSRCQWHRGWGGVLSQYQLPCFSSKNAV
jgi:hypothetical protein